MKTSLFARAYAFAISALFATVATIGVAVMMAASGEHARTEFGASTAVQESMQVGGPTLTQWQAPAPVAIKIGA
jgi:hypothetical protein